MPPGDPADAAAASSSRPSSTSSYKGEANASIIFLDDLNPDISDFSLDEEAIEDDLNLGQDEEAHRGSLSGSYDDGYADRKPNTGRASSRDPDRDTLLEFDVPVAHKHFSLRKSAIKFAITTGAITVGVAVLYALWKYEIISRFLFWLQDLPPTTGLIIYIPAFMFVSLPIGWGYVVLNLGAGYLWGLLAGQIVVMFAAAVGTFLATLLLRKCAVYVEPRIRSNAQVASLLAVINGPQAFKLIILTRLTPIPYGLQNALFSLVHVPMPEYMLATVTGLLPTQLLNTYFGTTLHSVEDVIRGGRLDWSTTAMFAGQMLVGVVLMVAVVYSARKQFQKHTDRAIELQRLNDTAQVV